MTPQLAVTIFLSGVFATIVAAMSATVSHDLYDTEIPRWIATLTRWGTLKPKPPPKLRERFEVDTEVWLDEAPEEEETGTLYSGKHRREEMIEDQTWRERWASYDTQGWPSIATHPSQLLDMRPDICVGRPAVPERFELPMLGWLARPAPVQPPILALADI